VSAARLLEALTSCGAQVWADGDRLEMDAPAGALTPDLLEALRSHKAELLALLTEASSPATDAAYGESVALTWEMLTACQTLADVSPPTDRAAWDVAHNRYQAKASQVRAFGRTMPEPERLAFHADVRARMYAIHHAWKAGQS